MNEPERQYGTTERDIRRMAIDRAVRELEGDPSLVVPARWEVRVRELVTEIRQQCKG